MSHNIQPKTFALSCRRFNWFKHILLFQFYNQHTPDHVAQSVGHLTSKSGSWVRYPVWQHTFVSPFAFSIRVVVSYWRKYVYEVLVNRLGGLSLPRKSVVRLTDRPDMTLDVYRGRKTTTTTTINIQANKYSTRLSSVELYLRFGLTLPHTGYLETTDREH